MLRLLSSNYTYNFFKYFPNFYGKNVILKDIIYCDLIIAFSGKMKIKGIF